MKARIRNGQRGLTLLLEVLLGLTLVTLVLLVIFQLFPVSDRSVGLADRTAHANYLARSLMDKQMERPYAELTPETHFLGEVKLDAHTKRRGSELSTEFAYRIDVLKLFEANAEIRDVVVTVSWKEGAANKARESSIKIQSARGNLW